MKTLQHMFSDLFSLIIPKDNNEVYTWKEIIIGILILIFLGFATSLMGKY